MQKIKPLGDRVIVKPLNAEEVTASGIVLPDTVDKEKPEQGEVIAVGPGKLDDNGKRMPIDVKKGDRVLIGKYSGNDIKMDDEEFLIVREDEILCVIEKKK